MGSSKKKAAAAAIALTVATAGLGAQAFVHPSPLFASKHLARRPLPSSSPAAAHDTAARPNNNRLGSWNLHQMMTATNEDLEREVSAMRAKDIRQELESYGISTKSFFEKGELVDALVKARGEGRTPVGGGANGDAATSASGGGGAGGGASAGGSSRSQRIQEEMEKCKGLGVGELKKELESYGISTKSYFEKSEFVRAVAEARVHGPRKSSASGSRASGGGGRRAQREEPYDPSYRDVIVTPFRGNKDLLEGKIITVRAC